MIYDIIILYNIQQYKLYQTLTEASTFETFLQQYPKHHL